MSERWDWEVHAECPNNGEPAARADDEDNEHITFDADATNSELSASEALSGLADPDDPMLCMVCGTPLEIDVEERQRRDGP